MTNTRMFKVLWAIQPAKFFLVLSVSTLICFSSCNKPTVIGLDVQPDNDLIDAEFQDTLTILTQTVKEDSLQTDGNVVYSGSGLIGKYWDPVFGQATSSLYSQMWMYANAPVFGTDPVIDSIRLTLVYNDIYGKKAKPRQNQLLNVYQLTEDLDYNASYFSHQTKTRGVEITETNGFVFKPRPTDSIVILGKKEAPALRVPIQKSFGKNIFDKQNLPELATNEDFLKFIKGIYITTENTSGIPFQEGNIVNFNIQASSLNIYYKNKTEDSLVFDLALTGARFMHFDHTYTPYADADIKKQLSTSSPVQNDIVFVQSMSGLKTKVKIPYLVPWGKREFIAVNRAELIIKSISTTKDTFALPPRLNLVGVNDDGKTGYILLDAFEGSNYFGGSLDTTDNAYHFTITRHVQQLISGIKTNNGFFIVCAAGSSTPTRAVLGGGTAVLNGSSTPNKYQMKLKVTYTKLK